MRTKSGLQTGDIISCRKMGNTGANGWVVDACSPETLTSPVITIHIWGVDRINVCGPDVANGSLISVVLKGNQSLMSSQSFKRSLGSDIDATIAPEETNHSNAIGSAVTHSSVRYSNRYSAFVQLLSGCSPIRHRFLRITGSHIRKNEVDVWDNHPVPSITSQSRASADHSFAKLLAAIRPLIT